MKVAIFSTQNFERPIFTSINQSHHHTLQFIEHYLNADSKALIANAEVVCCFVTDSLNKNVIDALSDNGVRLIALRSAGFNHVDCCYASEKNIRVCRVPAYSPHAVAEHAVAMILCLNRKIHRAYYRIREGDFSLHGLMGFDLHDCTVGVIGTGNIGSVFAQIMLGFGCKVIAYDVKEDPQCCKAGVQYVKLQALLRQADIISLHCPLSAQTHHMICSEAIDTMKTGVMLINTSRGQIIDTKAIIDGLKSRKIGYLGIDVYEEEENLFFADHSSDIISDDLFCRLQTFPNVLITGHQAFFTKQAVENIARTTLENISNFEQGKEPVYYVN